MLHLVANKKRLLTIRKRLQLKMGIKSQAFSVLLFEKAYLCCINIDNFFQIILFTQNMLQKTLYCAIMLTEIGVDSISYNIIWIMLRILRLIFAVK